MDQIGGPPEKGYERCGAYSEPWEELGKPKGWKGCSLPKAMLGITVTQ